MAGNNAFNILGVVGPANATLVLPSVAAGTEVCVLLNTVSGSTGVTLSFVLPVAPATPTTTFTLSQAGSSICLIRTSNNWVVLSEYRVTESGVTGSTGSTGTTITIEIQNDGATLPSVGNTAGVNFDTVGQFTLNNVATANLLPVAPVGGLAYPFTPTNLALAIGNVDYVVGQYGFTLSLYNIATVDTTPPAPGSATPFYTTTFNATIPAVPVGATGFIASTINIPLTSPSIPSGAIAVAVTVDSLTGVGPEIGTDFVQPTPYDPNVNWYYAPPGPYITLATAGVSANFAYHLTGTVPSA